MAGHTVNGQRLTPEEEQELSDLSGTLPVAIVPETPSSSSLLIQEPVSPFDLASPPPMLPPQPGDQPDNPNNKKGVTCFGVEKPAMTTAPTMPPLTDLLKNNFNIIVLVLLAVLVLRGR